MTMSAPKKAIALGARLKGCSNVETLGVRADFTDYTDAEREKILGAPVIYYPSSLYADLFGTMGKKTFPGPHSYRYSQDKIKQTALFKILGIPHPATRVFYGKRQKSTITDYFSFPFIAKIPRGSSMGRGVFLIQNENDLKDYLSKSKRAYIQEYLEVDKDMRIVVIGRKVIHAYWRKRGSDPFKTNLASGGKICFNPIPEAALKLAVKTAGLCQWDDVGLDILEKDNSFYVLEGNFKYGLQGFRKAGIDYNIIMEKLIENGDI